RAGGLDFHEGPDKLAREREAIGIDHSALGAWYGEHSKLPEALIQAMRFHHEPAEAGGGQGLVTLVAAADHMANHLQVGGAYREYVADDNPGLAGLWAHWPEGRKDRLRAEVPSL